MNQIEKNVNVMNQVFKKKKLSEEESLQVEQEDEEEGGNFDFDSFLKNYQPQEVPGMNERPLF